MFDNEENSNFTKSDSQRDGLADTESYRELLNDTETIKLLKKEINNIIDSRLQEMGISPKWKRIPQKTFEQSMRILQHQSDLLKKTIPNFNHTKKKLDKDIIRKCQKSLVETKQKNLVKTTEIHKKKTDLEERKDLIKNNKYIGRKQDNVKPRQNIVKIVCRPKPRCKTSAEKLILPTRRSSGTISNPILFETQDSSTDSEIYEPKTSMNYVITELKLNCKGSGSKKSLKQKETTNFNVNRVDTSDFSSPEPNGDSVKQKTRLQNKMKIHKEIITSTNNDLYDKKFNFPEAKKYSANRKAKPKNITIHKQINSASTSRTTNIDLYNAETNDFSSLESNKRFTEKKNTPKNRMIIPKRKILEISRVETNYPSTNSKSSLLSMERDLLKTDIKPKATTRFTDNMFDCFENYFENEKSSASGTNIENTYSSKTLRTKENLEKKDNKTAKNTKCDKGVVTNFKVNTAQNTSKTALGIKEQNKHSASEEEVTKDHQNNQKNVHFNQTLTSQEQLSNIKSNLDILESGSDENIAHFKTTEEVNIKKSSGFQATKITCVLPKIKKSMSEQVANKYKKVLFDVDND